MSRLSRFIHFYTDEDEGNGGGGDPGILKTVTGALLHITDALAKPAKKFTATLEPIQDLHGQDAPYPSGGGKNKLNDSVRHFASSNVFFGGATSATTLSLILSAGTYTYTCKYKSSNAVNLYAKNIQTATNIEGFPKYGSGSSNTATQTFTLTETTQISFYTYSPNITSVDDVEFAIVESGSSFTSYAPYSNICPITGWTGVDVTGTGKNIIDIPNLSGISVSNNNMTQIPNGFRLTKTQNSSAYSPRIFYLPDWVAGKTITFSADITITGTQNGGIRAIAYSGVYTQKVNYGDVSGTSGRISKTITFPDSLPSDADGFAINFYCAYSTPANVGDYTDYTNVMAELSSTSSTYEPYQSTTIPITFPDAAGTVYGCTLTLEDGEWKLRVTETAYTVPVNKIYLNNTWCYSDAVRTEFGYTSNFTIKKCNMLKPDRYTNLTGSTPIICVENGGYIYFGWDNMKSVFGNTQAEIREYLTNNPIVINFDLKEAITYTLTGTQALSLLKGENNIWVNDSDDLELTYYAKAEETP